MEQKSNISDEITQQFYKNVIESTIENSMGDWIQSGGNINTLNQLKEEWLYRAMTACGLTLEKPDTSIRDTKQKQVKEQQESQDLLSKIFGNLQLNEETEEEEEEEDSDDSDDAIDISSSDEKENSDSPPPPEESDSDPYGLNDIPADDPSIKDITEQVVVVDNLVCQYVKKNEKKAKKNLNLDLSCLHFTINGRPRVASSGKLALTSKN